MIRHNEKGFTLLELMFAIVMIGIISFMAIPFYNNYINELNEELVVADLNVLSMQLEEHKKKNYTYSSAVENRKLKSHFIQETPRNSDNPKYIITPYLFPVNSNVYIAKAVRKDNVSSEFYYLYNDGQASFIYYYKDGRFKTIQ